MTVSDVYTEEISSSYFSKGMPTKQNSCRHNFIIISQLHHSFNILVIFWVSIIPLCEENIFIYFIDSYSLNTWSKYIRTITQ